MTLVTITVIMAGILAAGIFTDKTSAAPGLALDLAGGTQIILEARTTDGSAIDADDLAQAVQIMRNRVDASGTAEAEITTQGDSNIIVSLPGVPDEATKDLVRKSAQLQFRPVLVSGFGIGAVTDPSASSSPSADPSASASPEATPSAAAEANPSASASAESSASPSAATEPETVVNATDPSDLAWVTPEVQAAYDALDCADPANLGGVDVGDPNAAFVTCSSEGLYKYILGPVELDGTDIASTAAGPAYNSVGTATGDYEVRLEFTGGGQTFFDVTSRLASLESPRNQFAILLDGVVISAPSVSSGIPGGTASITGDFTLATATQLSNQLKFGALPLTLEVQSEQVITATKGAEELRNGLIAGLIGLGLVVVYSFFQYRALAIVTIGSLVVAGGLTYLTIALLSWGIGYRLSLAGVVGLVVAIGITVDSFIVYFERVKDELREGRSLQAAVEHGWKRARRTIIASDAVNFLAAGVLYFLAVGNVRGFAFTLGLTTLIDLVVVMMFTHPMLALLARTKFFGDGHKFSGLDPRQFGKVSIYKGRGRFVEPTPAAMTLAERKAAAAKSGSTQEGE